MLLTKFAVLEPLGVAPCQPMLAGPALWTLQVHFEVWPGATGELQLRPSTLLTWSTIVATFSPGPRVILVLPLRVSGRLSLVTWAMPHVSWTDTKYVWPSEPWKLIFPLSGSGLLTMLTPGPDTEYTPLQLPGISAPLTRRSFS